MSIKDVIDLLGSTAPGKWVLDKTKDIRGEVRYGEMGSAAAALGYDTAAIDFGTRETTLVESMSLAEQAVALGHEQRHLWQLFHPEALQPWGYKNQHAARFLLTATEFDASSFELMIQYELRRKQGLAEAWSANEEVYPVLEELHDTHGENDAGLIVLGRYFMGMPTDRRFTSLLIQRENRAFQMQGITSPPLLPPDALMRLGQTHLQGNYLQPVERQVKDLFSASIPVPPPEPKA